MSIEKMPMVRLGEIFQCESKSGIKYNCGRSNGNQILLFKYRHGEQNKWSLLLQESDINLERQTRNTPAPQQQKQARRGIDKGTSWVDIIFGGEANQCAGQ